MGRRSEHKRTYVSMECPLCDKPFERLKKGSHLDTWVARTLGRKLTTCSPHCRGKLAAMVKFGRITPEEMDALAAKQKPTIKEVVRMEVNLSYFMDRFMRIGPEKSNEVIFGVMKTMPIKHLVDIVKRAYEALEIRGRKQFVSALKSVIELLEYNDINSIMTYCYRLLEEKGRESWEKEAA